MKRLWLAILPLVAGCEVAIVDLGSNHGGAAGQGGSTPDAGTAGGMISTGPVTTEDCPALTEAQAEVFYGHPCNGDCSTSFTAPRAVGSAAELVAVMQTQWRTCSGEVPWPAGVVGLELQPGCTIFLLHEAPDGGVARGVLPEDQGNFNVVETTFGDAATRSLVLYFPTFTWAVSAVTSDCPHRLRFTSGDGGVTDFAAVSSAPGPQ